MQKYNEDPMEIQVFEDFKEALRLMAPFTTKEAPVALDALDNNFDPELAIKLGYYPLGMRDTTLLQDLMNYHLAPKEIGLNKTDGGIYKKFKLKVMFRKVYDYTTTDGVTISDYYKQLVDELDSAYDNAELAVTSFTNNLSVGLGGLYLTFRGSRMHSEVVKFVTQKSFMENTTLKGASVGWGEFKRNEASKPSVEPFRGTTAKTPDTAMPTNPLTVDEDWL